MALEKRRGYLGQRTEHSGRGQFRLATVEGRAGINKEYSPHCRGRRHQVRIHQDKIGSVKANTSSPLISILSHLNNNNETTNTLYHPSHIHILYSTRLPNTNNAPGASSESALDRILFVPRLRQIIQCQSQSHRLQISLDLFITNLPDNSHLPTASPSELKIHSKRIAQDDIQKAIAGADNTLQPDETVCYLCGPPKMTDEMVGGLRELLGEDRVFFEKWW